MPKKSSNSVQVFYPPYSRTDLLARLRSSVSILRAALPLKRMWLFGSWANGKATAFSDIDVLLIYADPPRDDAYAVVRRLLKLRGLQPHVYSEQQADKLKPTLERMTRNGILLFPDL